MRIFIKLETGKTFHLDVDLDAMVVQLKSMIEEREQINVDR